MVTVTTTFLLKKEKEKEENPLLDSGRRFSKLDFSKAPWSDIRARLRSVDWSNLDSIAKEDVTAAHNHFIETILPIVEELVPPK